MAPVKVEPGTSKRKADESSGLLTQILTLLKDNDGSASTEEIQDKTGVELAEVRSFKHVMHGSWLPFNQWYGQLLLLATQTDHSRLQVVTALQAAVNDGRVTLNQDPGTNKLVIKLSTDREKESAKKCAIFSHPGNFRASVTW